MTAGHPRRWAVLVIACGALGAIVIDNTILSVALPTIRDSLDTDQTGLQWVTVSYGLVLSGLLLPLAVLGDRWGRKHMLLVGLTVFGVGSIVAAYSASAAQLAMARGLMGVGGACAMPTTLAIIGNVFIESERGRALAVWQATAGMAAVLGPVAGGLLLSHFWWGAVFLVNVPLVAATLVAAIVLVPDSRDPAAPPIDGRGSLFWFLALTAAVFAIVEGPVQGWVSGPVLVGFAVGALALFVFVRWERKARAPLLLPSTARDPRLRIGALCIAATFFAVFGAQYVTTQWLQGPRELGALAAGLCFAPMGLTSLAASAGNIRVASRLGHARVTAIGLVVIVLGLFGSALAMSAGSVAALVVTLGIVGVGIGFGAPSGLELEMSSEPPERAGSAAGVNETIVEAAGAVGVASLGSVLAAGAGFAWPLAVAAIVVVVAAAVVLHVGRRAGLLAGSAAVSEPRVDAP